MVLTLNIDKSLYPSVLEYSLSNGLTAAVSGVFDQTKGYIFPITAPTSGLAALNLELRFKKSNFDGISMRRMNNKQYELTDHLGNVRAVVGSSLKKANGYVLPTLIASTEYYPFGMSISSLSTNSEKYRYGFNGMEKDQEINGGGNIYTAALWEYDARIARRWNVDPVRKPWQSDYACFSNSPIWKIDPNGDDDYFGSDGRFIYRFSIGTEIVVIHGGALEDFSTFSANIANSVATVKILEHYKASAVTNLVELKNMAIDADPNTFGHTANFDGSMGYSNNLGIFINTKGGANKSFNDFNSLIDAIVHEGYHIKNGDNVLERSQVYTFQDHINVYNAQMDGDAIKRTSNVWKWGMVNNFARYLLGGINSREITPEDGLAKVLDFNDKYKEYGLEISFDNGMGSGRVSLSTRGRTNEGKTTTWNPVIATTDPR